MPVLGQRSISKSLNNFFLQHISDQIQVTYVIDGTIDFTLDGCVYSIKAGDIIINKPGQVFGALNETFPKSKSAFFKVYLEDQLTGWDHEELEVIWSSIQNSKFPHLTVGKEFYKKFQKIMQEHRSPQKFSPLKCRSLFQQMLLTIVEAHDNLSDSLKMNSSLSNDMLSTVNKFVSENLHRKIYSAEMAEVVGLSESHFRYLFSTVYKTNPADFVLRKRIEKSKELLRSSQNITSIAYELAFSSSQYFSNSFKKLTGMLPKEYRKALKEIAQDSHKIFGDQETSDFMLSFYD